MTLEGGCYCGAVRYQAEGRPQLKAQCHCRECQYITGGGPNFFLLMPPDGFRYTKGAPKQFTRSDRKPGHARVLRRVRNASGNPAPGSAVRHPKSGKSR